MSSLLENKCPKCHEGAIVSRVFVMNRECERCGYIFESEPGAFTGALYLNLSIMGLTTFPFLCMLALPNANIPGVAILTILWLLIISPISLRLTKIFWANMIFKKK